MVPGYDSRQARTTLVGLTKPDPKERAAQIVAWAICWPWNLVWTLCVYNPFRYVGEFLLRELQSALFEISNGQFRAIERDLTIEPLPPPYPVPERSTRHDKPVAQATSLEVTNVSSSPVVEAGPSTDDAEHVRTKAGASSTDSATIEVAAVVDQSEPISSPRPDELAPDDEVADEESVEDIPTEIEAAFAEGGSSDSYIWAPPEATAFVPLSDRPLKAVKYDTGSTLPSVSQKQSALAQPATDPWFEKHTPK